MPSFSTISFTAAEAAIHLRELESDVTAADDDQMLGKKVELHDARAVQVVDVLYARHVGDEWWCSYITGLS